MAIVYLESAGFGRQYLEIDSTGNSDEVVLRNNTVKTSIILSNIANGDVTVEFTLSPLNKIRDGTAVWHQSRLVNKTTLSSVSFTEPVFAVKVVCSTASTTYKFEILSVLGD